MKKCLCALLVLALVPALVLAEDPPATRKSAEVADYKALKEALPEKLLNLARTNLSGQKIKQGEMVMATAEAQYGRSDGENARAISINVVDYAGMPGMGETLAVWEKIEMEQESDEGFTKLETVNGRKLLLTHRTQEKSGSIQLFLNKRLMVTIEASNVSADELRAIAKEFNPEKLAAAAPEAE